MNTILKPYDGLRFDAQFNEKLKPADSLCVQSVRASKIIYCLYGRNAWHSTWVQKYSNDCMHLTIESAKAHAESKRVQGSVFYIKELPALEIDAGPYRVFVTQINSSCPLRDFRCETVRETPSDDASLLVEARDRYLSAGASLEGTVLSFDYDSRFWIAPQPPENSVMILYSDSDLPAQELRTTRPKAWISSSVGKHYYLNWSRIDSSVSGQSVLRILKRSAFGGGAGQ